MLTGGYLGTGARVRAIAVGAAAIIAVSMAGCGTAGDPAEATSADLPGATFTSSPWTPADVEVVPFEDRGSPQGYLGDCHDEADAANPLLEARVPCDEPHNLEIIGELDAVEGIEYTEDARQEFHRRCAEQAEENLGIPLDEVPLIFAFAGTTDRATGLLTGTVSCTLVTHNGPIITASVLDHDPREILSGWRHLPTLEPGTCFELGEQPSLGLPSDCEQPNLLFLGTITAEDGPYPGEDALRAQRDDECPDLLDAAEDAGVEVDPEHVSGTLPDDFEWGLGLRVTTCDVAIA